MKKTLSFFIIFFAIVNFASAQIPQIQWSKNWNPFGGYSTADYFDLIIGDDGFLYINGYTGSTTAAFSVTGKFTPQGDSVFKKLDTEISTWGAGWSGTCVLERKNKLVHISSPTSGNNHHLVFNNKTTGNFIDTNVTQFVSLVGYGDTIVAITNGSGAKAMFLDEYGTFAREFSLGQNTSGITVGKILGENLWIFTKNPSGGIVLKYNIFTGQLLWQVSVLGAVRVFGDIDSLGNSYIGSSIFVSGTYNKFQLKKIDPSGNVSWIKEFLPNGTVIANSQNFVNSVAVSTYKNLVVLGAEILRDSLTQNAGSSRSGYVMARNLNGDSVYAMRITDNPVYKNNQVQSIAFHNGYLVVLGKNWDGTRNPQSIGWLKKYGDSLTGIEPNEETAEKYSLSQNYPNPFNPITTIEFSIPEKSSVKITVFDILGKEIEVLVNEVKTKGNFSITFDGKNLSSGIYFYKIETPEFTETKKMLLVK